MGHELRRLHQLQINRQPLSEAKNAQQYGTRIRFRNFSEIDILLIAKLCWLPKYRHSDRCFSRQLFAYRTQNVTTETIGHCIVDVMTRHAYLPKLKLSNKGSQFRSEVVAETTKLLDIQIKTSTEHAQKIGILELTHASLKRWHQNFKITVLNFNKNYHETLGCEPSTCFH